MGWWTDPETKVSKHTRTYARTMREHRTAKREDAEERNRHTPEQRRASYRRAVFDSIAWGREHAQMKRDHNAADVSKRGMRKRRKTRTDHEAAKQIRDLATAAGQTYEVYTGDVVDPYAMHRAVERVADPYKEWAIEHKTAPAVPEQMTARQMDVYDLLGDI